jgi:putative ABC transport system permease protein
MPTLTQDLRFGARMLARSPAFAATAILALALGIGASTAVFSVLDAVVLRPLPYSEPDRLVTIWDAKPSNALAHEPLSPVTFLDDRGLTQVFEDAAGWWRPNLNLADSGQDPTRVSAIEVSANFFKVLGVRPALGAGFDPEPLYVGSSAAVVISDRLWRTRYGSDPGIVGRSLQLNGRLHTVLGVMGPGFDFPADVDVYQRLVWDFAQHSRGAHFIETVARLKPGVTLEQANAELRSLHARVEREFAATNKGWTAFAVPLAHEVAGFFRPALYSLLGAVGLLLLVACTNVANLLLARATVREREVALRAAIGASRGRIVRQLLTESVVLALAGAALGVLFAGVGVTLLVRFAPIEIPRLDEVAIDARVLGFAVAVSLMTALIFGVLPSLFLARTDLQGALKTGVRGASSGAGGSYARRTLVAAEVGLAVMLLVTAGLLVRSVLSLVREDPGFRSAGLVTGSIELPERQYRDWPSVARFYAELGRVLRENGAVAAAGLANVLPLAPGWRVPLLIEGRPRPREEDAPRSQHISIDEFYFQSLSVPLRSGRWFNERDNADAPGVVVINEAFAKAFWPGENPLGQHLVSFARQIGPLGRTLIESSRYEIVGIAADTKNASLQNATEPAIFYAQRQFPFRSMHVFVRGAGGVERLTGAIREAIRQLDPNLPLSRVTTLDRIVAQTVDRPRMLTAIMSAFAGLALILAWLGIYGVLSYTVSQRRQELSVRMALGAERGAIVWLIVRQGLMLAAVGLALGAAGGYALGRLLSGLLYGVTPTDPPTFAAVLATVGVIAIAACLLPARRAAATDLLDALRGE